MASDDDKTKAGHGHGHDHGHDRGHDHAHDHGHGDSHASSGHEAGEPFVGTSSWQDMLLNAVCCLCLLGLAQMIYTWMSFPNFWVAAESTEHGAPAEK